MARTWMLAIALLGGCSLDYDKLMGGAPPDGDAGLDAAVDGETPDGTTPDGAVDCVRNADCRDSNFCNGVERCDVDTGVCVAGDPPDCMCDAALNRCVTNCDVSSDGDEDGYDAIECAGDDCNDGDANVHPDATEVCDPDGLDEDCNATTVPPDQVWYADADDDGYGDPFVSASDCAAPDGYVADATDCNDIDGEVNPAKAELCNGVDDNCAGGVDEGLPTTTYYSDGDGDMYGSFGADFCASTPPAGYAALDGDCNDGEPAVHPGATDGCNGVDDDCDTTADTSFACPGGTNIACTACGFTGVQSCDAATCTPVGACAGFSFSTMRIEGDDARFAHACGDDCGGGEDWCMLGPPTACNILDGLAAGQVGITAPPGSYRATFTHADGPSAPTFYVLDGSTILGMATGATTAGGVGSPTVVDFTVPSTCADLSFRITLNSGGRIRLYYFEVARTGD